MNYARNAPSLWLLRPAGSVNFLPARGFLNAKILNAFPKIPWESNVPLVKTVISFSADQNAANCFMDAARIPNATSRSGIALRENHARNVDHFLSQKGNILCAQIKNALTKLSCHPEPDSVSIIIRRMIISLRNWIPCQARDDTYELGSI